MATAFQVVTENGHCMSGGYTKMATDMSDIYTKWPLHVRWLHKMATACQMVT
jgi:hypothetical protein